MSFTKISTAIKRCQKDFTTVIPISVILKTMVLKCYISFFQDELAPNIIMIITNTKPHLLKRIVATIIDYELFFMFLFIYIGFFRSDNGDGGQQVIGSMNLPFIIVWFTYFVLS